MIMSWNFYYCTEQFCKSGTTSFIKSNYEPFYLFRLDALALSVIATATSLAGWVGGCLSQPVLYQND